MITQFLDCQSHFQVVGASTSGEEALRMIPAVNPDVVLMDISMPGLNGIETTQRLKMGKPELPVVMLTMHDSPVYRDASARAGADGFILKSDCWDQLVEMLEQCVLHAAVLRGKIPNCENDGTAFNTKKQ